MRIANDRELEQAVAEAAKLAEATPDGALSARRKELEGAITAYYAERKDELRKGRPDHVETD